MLGTSPALSHIDSTQWHALPPIYILPTHLTSEGLHELEDKVTDLGAPLTYDAKEAKIFLGKAERKSRAAFDLRSRGVWTDENVTRMGEPGLKKRRIDGFSSPAAVVIMQSDIEVKEGGGRLGETTKIIGATAASGQRDFVMPDLEDRLLVVHLTWLEESLRQHRLLSLEPFVVYDARPSSKTVIGEINPLSPYTPRKEKVETLPTPTHSSLLQHENRCKTAFVRTQAEARDTEEKGHPVADKHRRRFKTKSLPLAHRAQVPKLKRMTTSEFEEIRTGALPDPPQWVKCHSMYSCLRSTFSCPPNARFASELEKIKKSRILTQDEIGVRAYSTSIASLSAYPYLVQSPQEIVRLPGCDERLAALFSKFQNTSDEDCKRYLPAARDLDNDESLQTLKIFSNIWGCGADAARKMYFTQGWKSIDDIVEFGWSTLSRAQQIGVKYYEEFKAPIARKEVEEISEIILQHARKARGIPDNQAGTEDDVVAVIVGGYRRGKDQCGDVDVILSHRVEHVTHNLVVDVVSELERSGYITHTLTLNTTTSQRGQQTLPYTTGHGGHGFDSLDKALCVWQDPHFNPTTSPPTSPHPQQNHSHGDDQPVSYTSDIKTQDRVLVKNPNVHRRVDIVVSPWRTIGAAVLGWSGATTFERDIRRWCRKEKGWKFDSSGVRDRKNGHVLDLEAPRPGDEKDTWIDRERRLMKALGIGWRPAMERCTG